MTRTRVLVQCGRTLAVFGVAAVAGAATRVQGGAPAPKPTPICATGVLMYTDLKQVPAPYDTLTMPEMPGQMRVTSEEEAAAAELAMRGRAGSVGATGVVVSDVTEEEGGNMRIRRSVTAVRSPSDTLRALKACKS